MGGFFHVRVFPGEMEAICSSFLLPSTLCRRWLLPSALALACGGVVNLLEGYGSDNPGAKSQGMKQLMAGGGIIVLGTTLIPLLSGLF